MAEFLGAMAWLGLPPPLVVPMSRSFGGGLLQEACGMLSRGQVDMVADFEDLLPRVRRHAAMNVRAVPLGAEVYSSGLVARDNLSSELVDRMAEATVAALERQRRDSELGIREIVARCPRVVPDDAREGWQLVEPRIFADQQPGSMTAHAWAETIAYTCAAQGLIPVSPERVYRPERCLFESWSSRTLPASGSRPCH
jgi:hypothetical protein